MEGGRRMSGRWLEEEWEVAGGWVEGGRRMSGRW